MLIIQLSILVYYYRRSQPCLHQNSPNAETPARQSKIFRSSFCRDKTTWLLWWTVVYQSKKKDEKDVASLRQRVGCIEVQTKTSTELKTDINDWKLRAAQLEKELAFAVNKIAELENRGRQNIFNCSWPKERSQGNGYCPYGNDMEGHIWGKAGNKS